MITPSISSAFNSYFQVVFADTAELRQEVYRIRYEVYCRELGYEDANAFPDGLETDVYDARSLHCLLQHRSSGIYAGCIRLVLPDAGNPEANLPFEDTCRNNLYPDIAGPLMAHRHKVGEYSRLAVPECFRRRNGEKGVAMISEEMPVVKAHESRQFLHIPLGLYLAGAAIAVSSGLEGVVAMMEPRLARHLKRFGMIYQQMGDVVDHRGARAPFYCDRDTLFSHLDPGIRKMLDALLADVPSYLKSA